jgi:phage baseplate assembly protein gpV
LDTERNRERTTFADGTTVTVDWAAEQVEVRENPAQSAEVR